MLMSYWVFQGSDPYPMGIFNAEPFAKALESELRAKQPWFGVRCLPIRLSLNAMRKFPAIQLEPSLS